MKVYVVYIIADYSTAVFMSTNKGRALDYAKRLHDRTGRHTYVESCDFSLSECFLLDND